MSKDWSFIKTAIWTYGDFLIERMEVSMCCKKKKRKRQQNHTHPRNPIIIINFVKPFYALKYDGA